MVADLVDWLGKQKVERMVAKWVALKDPVWVELLAGDLADQLAENLDEEWADWKAVLKAGK